MKNTPVCPLNTSLCVRSKRPVYTGTTRKCWSTCARGAGTHGDVLNENTGRFESKHNVFSVPHHTTPHTHHNTRHNTQDTTTTNTPQQHTETETERDTEKERRKTREDERRKTREDERRETREDESFRLSSSLVSRLSSSLVFSLVFHLLLSLVYHLLLSSLSSFIFSCLSRLSSSLLSRLSSSLLSLVFHLLLYERQEKMKDEREREERWEKRFFFLKNVSEPSNPPDELAQNVSKKIPFGRIFPRFFLRKFKIWQCFSIIYMIRIQFFGLGELFQKGFRAAQYSKKLKFGYHRYGEARSHRFEWEQRINVLKRV